MSLHKIIPYNPELKQLARQLRKNSILAEVLLWQNIKNRNYGYEFHRQVPLNEFIVDFYSHELRLAIEIDGNTHNYNYEKDNRRQEILEGLGIIFLRFDDNDVKRHMNDVLRSIEAAIVEIEEKKNNQ